MFFILSKVDSSNPERILHTQLGVVIADNLDIAAAKIGLAIEAVGEPPETAILIAFLQDGYQLEEMPEIANPADLVNSSIVTTPE